MSNVVEYLVKIRDLASNQFRTIGNNADGAFNRISARVSRTSATVDQLSSRIDALTRTRDISLDTRQINRANREIADLERRRDRLTNSNSGGGTGFFGKSLILGGLGAALAIGGTALKAGMERQMAGTSFQVMAGVKDGDKLHKNLMGFATDTIYGNEVFGEAKTMLGFGIQAKNIMPALRMLGDVAMGDVEHMKSLSLVFAQTASAGKLTGQDLLQYVSAGFNPLQALSQKTGRSMADLRKDTEKGKISFRDVGSAFEYATGPLGRFHNGMQKMGETPTGKWLAFKGALETLGGTIGMRLLPALGGIADFLSGLIGQPQLLENIAWSVGLMAAAWGGYTLWVERAKIQTWLLEAAAAWPLALVGVLAYAYNDLDKLNVGYTKSTTTMADKIGSVFDVLRRTFEDTVYVLQTAMLGVESVFQRIGNIAKAKRPTDVWNAIKDDTEADKKINQLRIDHIWKRANDLAGLDENGKQKSKASWMDSKLDYKGQAGGGAPGSVTDTAKGIAGGGVRNLTINIAKMGIDEVTIHATTLTEGVDQIRRTFIEMFNQVINSGNAAVNPN